MKNQYKTKGNITEIYVQSPKYGLKTILIDTEDLELVSDYSWCVNKDKNSFYSISTKKPQIKLHRLIMSFPKDKIIDHANHNCLDDRKENLRICTSRQNQGNQKISKNNTSGFKGVHLSIDRKGGKEYKYWRSQIIYNNKRIGLGLFPHTEKGKIQAAMTYDLKAVKLFGSFALLNFPKLFAKHEGILCTP